MLTFIFLIMPFLFNTHVPTNIYKNFLLLLACLPKALRIISLTLKITFTFLFYCTNNLFRKMGSARCLQYCVENLKIHISFNLCTIWYSKWNCLPTSTVHCLQRWAVMTIYVCLLFDFCLREKAPFCEFFYGIEFIYPS